MPDCPTQHRLQTAGKFFRRGGGKVYLSGVTYGPFGPGEADRWLPGPDRVQADLDLIRSLGSNALRLYHAPPEWFLEACASRDLQCVVSLPWTDHVDFLSDRATRRQTLLAIRREAQRLGKRPEVSALLVGNEINTTLVRWLGPRRVLGFVEDLIDAAKQSAPETLVTYASYPSTEYLIPANGDFVAFNVYLEQREAFERYLARLQNLAGDRPLVVSEFGADARRLGDQAQADLLAWQRDAAVSGGVAGNFVFAFTDEWFRGGAEVTGWEFGLVDRHRNPKAAFHRLRKLGPLGPPEMAPDAPRISVIVCTRNGARTLDECLTSLERLDYPNFEIIAVDDGSTDDSRGIIARHAGVRLVVQEVAGLSVARNNGADHATGEILAYTDDDCVADRDWLRYLCLAFRDSSVACAGGPNIPPPAQSLAQACVIAAPGGPAHVLLTDVQAEHVPGCNLAVRRSAFDEVGGFLPQYRTAGDDVDFCWRLLERGGKIAFHPGAMVWHYRRFSPGAYLRQQRGYGRAEGLLLAQHSARFGHFGGARWRGVVYQPALLSMARKGGRIYSGAFGHAPFQVIYSAPLSDFMYLTSSFPWMLVAAVLLVNFTWSAVLGSAGAAMLLLTLLVPLRHLFRLSLPADCQGIRGRCLLWGLLILQPLLRGMSRFFWGLRSGGMPSGPLLGNPRKSWTGLRLSKPVAELAFWNSEGKDREDLLREILKSLRQSGLPHHVDDGWKDWDIEVRASAWWAVKLTTVTEYHEQQRRLTRLRLSTRATWVNLAFNVLLTAGLIVTAALCWSVSVAVGAAAGGTLWWVVMENVHRRVARRAAGLGMVAAAECGLVPATSTG